MPISDLPIVVYGANGFVGRNLLLALSSLSAETLAVSRSFGVGFSKYLSDSVRCIELDFHETDALFETVVPRNGATHILLVSDSVPSTWTQTPSREVSGNLLSHVRFLERLQSSDRVIFLSSGGTVYGVPAERRPLREEDAKGVPISAYGLTKLTIEKYLEYSARVRGFDHLTLRAANPVGPWTKANAAQGFVSVLLENHLAGRATHVWGDGGVTRDYLDVRDLARAIVASCGLEQLGGAVFNVGSGIGRNLNEIVALVRQTLGIDLAVEFDEERDVDVPYNVLDCARIKQRIGWQPSYALETTIRDTWSFLLSRREESSLPIDTHAPNTE